MNRRAYRFICWLLPLGLAGCQDRPPEVHLVPVGYEGPLLVVYNQPGFPSLPRSGDSLVFDFRPSRVLRTRDSLVTGAGFVNAFQYYYVNAAGKRTRIRKVVDGDELQQRSPTEPCIVTTWGNVYSGAVCELLTSSRFADRNGAWQLWLADSLTSVGTPQRPRNLPPPPPGLFERRGTSSVLLQR